MAGYPWNLRNNNVHGSTSHSHASVQWPERLTIACRICDHPFVNIQALIDHLELHMNDENHRPTSRIRRGPINIPTPRNHQFYHPYQHQHQHQHQHQQTNPPPPLSQTGYGPTIYQEQQQTNSTPMPVPPPPLSQPGYGPSMYQERQQTNSTPMPVPPPPLSQTGYGPSIYQERQQTNSAPMPVPPPPHSQTGYAPSMYKERQQTNSTPIPVPPPPLSQTGYGPSSMYQERQQAIVRPTPRMVVAGGSQIPRVYENFGVGMGLPPHPTPRLQTTQHAVVSQEPYVNGTKPLIHQLDHPLVATGGESSTTKSGSTKLDLTLKLSL